MKLVCSVLAVIVSFFNYHGTNASSISEEFARIPRIFYVNETVECPDDHYFCKVHIKLKPRNIQNPPDSWELIKKQDIYQRDHLYRALCIGRESIREKLDEDLQQYNLTYDIVESSCYRQSYFNQNYGFRDLIFLSLSVTYMAFIIYCTIRTSYAQKKVNKYVKVFSLTNIWREIMAPNRNEDYQNLICIQGMRTFGTTCVIGIHTGLSTMIFTFIQNPEYFEDVPNNLGKFLFQSSFGLIVQIFFVISAWLLAVHLHNIVREKGRLTFSDLILLWLNRYVRFLPAVVVILMVFNSKAFLLSISHPYHYSVTRAEVEICELSWWKNLLFLQNMLIEEKRMCSPGMWYIAADFQLYVVVSTFFYISRKFGISMKYFLGLMAFTSLYKLSFTIFTNDMNGLLRFTPRLLPAEEAWNTAEGLFSYFNTFGSSVTYIIGFTFGTIYWHNKKNIIFNTKMKKLIFYVGFLSFPIIACYAYGFKSDKTMEILKGVSLRPLFSLGIAIGLLGMVDGTGGYLKKFFESRHLVFFGSFTYSVYMFHFFCVFGRTLSWFQYAKITDFYNISLWIVDIITSFSFGMIMYIILEHPFIRLQKNVFPQVTMRKGGEHSKMG